MLRPGDGGEHRGEDLVAVLEGAHAVAVEQRRAEELAERTVELRVADAVGQLDFVADLSLVRDEVARQQRADRPGGGPRTEEREGVELA